MSIEPWDPAADPAPLRRVLHRWLETRGLPPLGFLVEPETLGRLQDRPIFVARQGTLKGGSVVGFLVASPVPQRRGWLVEQNIRRPEAPNGTTELLLDAAMRALAAEGAELVTLGLCPLSRRAFEAPALEGRGTPPGPPERWWLRALLGWLRAHGRRFYNFDGLDAYKAKFQPERWEPLWAVAGEGHIGARDLWAITQAFGNMAPPMLVARALGRALAQEARWLRTGRR